MAPGSRDDDDIWAIERRREGLIERQIREAMSNGAFDNLPHQGERLPLVDDAAAGDWALAFRMLKNGGYAPPWIEADKEVRGLLARRDAVLARASRARSAFARGRDRDELVRIVREHARAVAQLNADAPTERQHRQPLILDEELERLDRLHRAGDGG